jgi:hypothetical protein
MISSASWAFSMQNGNKGGGRNHIKNMTLSGAPLKLRPRRYGTPCIAIVTYYLLRANPLLRPSPDGGLVAQEGGFVSHEMVFSRAEMREAPNALRIPSGRIKVVSSATFMYRACETTLKG